MIYITLVSAYIVPLQAQPVSATTASLYKAQGEPCMSCWLKIANRSVELQRATITHLRYCLEASRQPPTQTTKLGGQAVYPTSSIYSILPFAGRASVLL